MSNTNTKINLPRPDEIKSFLDQYVIGQEEAKRILSVAVYNHYKKLENNFILDNGVELEKSNIILLGDTGCGKTLLIKTIAKLIDVPCYIQDCTKITASGYVGSDVEDCIVGLLRASEYQIAKAQCGIVMLDEGDKIANKIAGPSITRDVSGECVQQSLLKIVEGEVVGVPPMGGRKHPEQSLVYVDTSNILFILSGAFVGLDSIIKKRLGKNKIGFDSQVETKEFNDDTVFNKYATSQDIRDFGLIPEFVGRFPIITNVNPLSKEDLIRILTEPKNSIVKQYTELLKMDNVTLTFNPEALERVAELAVETKTGARGLRTIMEGIMTDIMYDAPLKVSKSKKNLKINITIDTVNKALEGKFGYDLSKIA